MDPIDNAIKDYITNIQTAVKETDRKPEPRKAPSKRRKFRKPSFILTLPPGEEPIKYQLNERPIRSPNGKYELYLHHPLGLVVEDIVNHQIIWIGNELTNQNFTTGYWEIDEDGELTAYNSNGNRTWRTYQDPGPTRLDMQNDGNFKLTLVGGAPYWLSGLPIQMPPPGPEWVKGPPASDLSAVYIPFENIQTAYGNDTEKYITGRSYPDREEFSDREWGGNWTGGHIPPPRFGYWRREVPGCMDPLATNYNPLANKSNGSCTYPPPPVLGCMDPLATNYNPLATQDNGSCTYPPPPQAQSYILEGTTLDFWNLVDPNPPPNAHLISPNGQFRAWHSGGVLRIEDTVNSVTTWQSRQPLGSFAGKLWLTESGNLKLTEDLEGNTLHWDTNTSTNQPVKLEMRDDGNLAITWVDQNANPGDLWLSIWSSQSSSIVIDNTAIALLNPNEKLISPNGKYELYLTTEGILKVHDTELDTTTWQSHDTPWPNSDRGKLNFVEGDVWITNNSNQTIWGTDTYDPNISNSWSAVKLEMRDDGNFALVSSPSSTPTPNFTVWLSGLSPPPISAPDPNTTPFSGWTFLATESIDSVFYLAGYPPNQRVDVAYGNPETPDFEEKLDIVGRVEFSNRSKWSTNNPDGSGDYWPIGKTISGQKSGYFRLTPR